MQLNEAEGMLVSLIRPSKQLSVGLPARGFWNIDAHEHLATLSELGTFGDEAKPAEVHICATHDGYKALASTDEVVGEDIVLETRQCQCACGLSDGSCIW